MHYCDLSFGPEYENFGGLNFGLYCSTDWPLQKNLQCRWGPCSVKVAVDWLP